jgi:DegV family protein with EDD domain
VAAAEAAARATRVYGALPDLQVAVKGGRVSAPAAMIAGLIELKPLIVFDEEGATRIAGARLGYRRALQAVADKVARYAAGGAARVVIVHADGLESAQFVKERLAPMLHDTDIPIVQAGAVITTHVGLGTVAVGVQQLG